MKLDGSSKRRSSPVIRKKKWKKRKRARASHRAAHPARYDPKSPDFLVLVNRYRRAGLYEEALEVCREGLKHRPDYLSARVALGMILIESGSADEAQTELEAVLEAAPANLLSRRALANLYRVSGNPDKARKEFEEVLWLAPGDTEALEALGSLAEAGGAAALETEKDSTLTGEPPASETETQRTEEVEELGEGAAAETDVSFPEAGEAEPAEEDMEALPGEEPVEDLIGAAEQEAHRPAPEEESAERETDAGPDLLGVSADVGVEAPGLPEPSPVPDSPGFEGELEKALLEEEPGGPERESVPEDVSSPDVLSTEMDEHPAEVEDLLKAEEESPLEEGAAELEASVAGSEEDWLADLDDVGSNLGEELGGPDDLSAAGPEEAPAPMEEAFTAPGPAAEVPEKALPRSAGGKEETIRRLEGLLDRVKARSKRDKTP